MNEIKITEQQRRIITAPEDKIVVMSSAGTSKTFCLIERIKWLVSQGTLPSHIVAITFTNNAAQEIINRLEPLQIGFCGTVHSFANFLLHTEQIATRETIESEDFDELFNLVKQNPRCVDNFPVDHLLLDEAQDSNNHQFEFILEMVNPKRFTILGDEKQTIYAFAGSNPDLIVNLSQTDGVATYKLSENFRNARVIHEFGKWAIERMNCGYYDNSTLMRNEIGKKITILYNLETVANYILQDGKFGEWFVLTRTNAQLETVKSYLESRGIFCDTFKQKEVNLGQLQEKMKQNTVKVLTIHSSKGLQQKKVVVIGATIPEPNYYTHRVPLDMVEEGRLAYVAITRAQDFLLWVKRRRVKKEQEQKFRSWE